MGETLLAVASEAADAAAGVHRRHAGRVSQDAWSEKGVADFVTHVDREAEDAIIRVIRSHYPDHAILAEEGATAADAAAATDAEHLWIIDPLDGTTNFLHGYPMYAVSIAFAEGDRLERDARNIPVPAGGEQVLPDIVIAPLVGYARTGYRLGYGGGVDTVVGAGSVAVPGSLAALELAWRRYGAVPWAKLLEPAIRAARDGFPLPSACHHYLCYSGTPVFGRSQDGHAALHDAAGRLRAVGSTVRVPHLADSLDAIAREGTRIFYEGEIAGKIAEHVQQCGGALTLDDLRHYEAIVRDCLCVEMNDWCIATNPPPAVGGAVLAAMLLAFRDREMARWDAASLEYLMHVQRAALAWRRSAGGLADFERWEFSRNDATVNATGRAPLLGSREWPEPLGPPERPVLFWLWRQ